MNTKNGVRNIEQYTDDLKRVALEIDSEVRKEESRFILITKRKLTEPEHSAIRRTLTYILAPEE